MAPEYHYFQDNHTKYDAIEEWECLICFKKVTASGSSALHADACNCVDVGSFTQDHNRPQEEEALEKQAYQYQSQGRSIHIQPQSYASSSVSAPCPEGPEREDPNTTVTNGQLQVMVDPAINDARYRLSSSEPPRLTLQLWRFLVEQGHNRPGHGAEPATPDAGFLAHDFHIRSKKRGSSNKRKASHQSGFSSSSDEPSFSGYDADPVTGIGTWDERGNYVYSSDEYPLTMSGLVDYPAEG